MAFPTPPILQKMYDAAGTMTSAWVDWYARLVNYNTEVAGTFAPIDAQYIVRIANNSLTNEQALNTLNSGFLKVTAGTGVLSSTENNKIQSTDLANTAVTAGDYTINGLAFTTVDAQGRITYMESPTITASAIGLGNVENTALSTWAGSTNITTLGTIVTGSIPYSVLTGVAASGANSDITSLTGITGGIKAPTGIKDTFNQNVLEFSGFSSSTQHLTIYNDSSGYPGFTSNAGIAFITQTNGVYFFDNTSFGLNGAKLNLQTGTGNLITLATPHSGSGLSGDYTLTLPATQPTNGYIISTDGSGNLSFIPNTGGGGTVTSVTYTGDGTVHSSTPSSAVTSSGTLTASLKTQNANKILAGPISGSDATPTFRRINLLDMPYMDSGTYTYAGGV